MTAAPRRIQRKRTRGWKMPPNTVYVGRPTMWGNHAPISDRENRAYSVAWFRRWVEETASWAWKGRAQIELRDKNLACWCRLCPAHADGKPVGIVCDDCAHCHADVLLELANVAENESAPLMPAGRSL